MRRLVPLALVLVAAAAPLSVARAQGASPAAAAPATPSPLRSLTSAQRIAAALLPMPVELREGATVMGVDEAGKLVTLRQGTGDMTCLAPDPRAARFHVACYHRGMEAFMARGRALRAEGVKGDQVDSIRFREVREGTLRMPTMPASLYSLTGAVDTYDPVANTAAKAQPLSVLYIPGATSATTGLTTRPTKDAPWLMGAGTPKAHIMFVHEM